MITYVLTRSHLRAAAAWLGEDCASEGGCRDLGGPRPPDKVVPQVICAGSAGGEQLQRGARATDSFMLSDEGDILKWLPGAVLALEDKVQKFEVPLSPAQNILTGGFSTASFAWDTVGSTMWEGGSTVPLMAAL